VPIVGLEYAVKLDDADFPPGVALRVLGSLPHFVGYDASLELYHFGRSLSVPTVSIRVHSDGFVFIKHMGEASISNEIFGALVAALAGNVPGFLIVEAL
jgi:hypothetical protein